MEKTEIIDYWVSSSEIDFDAMESLARNGHYVWALFIGHLVLEKLLKAYYVKIKNDRPPYIHDLLKLAQEASLALSVEQKTFLDEMTSCNIRARYPDFKNRFYKRATEKFTEEKLSGVKEFKEWLLKMINN